MDKEHLRRADNSTFVFIPPKKGVDYWTPADQESIVQQVITALGTPVFGRVDVDNNIILTGELADGTYTLKYEDAEGNVTEIGTIEVGGDEYTNWIKRSVESDGITRYNGGQGWKADTRYSASSGIEKEEPGVYITGFIPVKKGDVVRMKNITMNINNTNAYAKNLCYFWGLPEGITITIALDNLSEWNAVFDGSGNLTQFTIPEDYPYILINASYIGDDSIITINQEIPE